MSECDLNLISLVPSGSFLRETRSSGRVLSSGSASDIMKEVGQITYKRNSNFILKGNGMRL